MPEEAATRREADTKVTEEAVEALKKVTNRNALLQLNQKAHPNALHAVKMVTFQEIALPSKVIPVVLLLSSNNPSSNSHRTTTKVTVEDTRATMPAVDLKTTVEVNKTTMVPKVENTKRLTTRNRPNPLRKLLKYLTLKNLSTKRRKQNKSLSSSKSQNNPRKRTLLLKKSKLSLSLKLLHKSQLNRNLSNKNKCRSNLKPNPNSRVVGAILLSEVDP
jgi:hypothetical protein